MNRLIDEINVCDAVERLLNILERLGFLVEEQYVSDYHFFELYFKVSGNTDLIKDMSFEGFSRIENKLICNCHWSTVEIIESSRNSNISE
jgi:hypothetical protein